MTEQSAVHVKNLEKYLMDESEQKQYGNKYL